jgi:hypothetical protein
MIIIVVVEIALSGKRAIDNKVRHKKVTPDSAISVGRLVTAVKPRKVIHGQSSAIMSLDQKGRRGWWYQLVECRPWYRKSSGLQQFWVLASRGYGKGVVTELSGTMNGVSTWET